MYWPRWFRWFVKPEQTVECFIKSFRLLGYIPCSDSHLESGYEKIALYAHGTEPTHMARQLVDGNWTSKLGILGEDITHYTLDAIEEYGPEPIYADYGAPVAYMRRRLIIAKIVRWLQAEIQRH